MNEINNKKFGLKLKEMRKEKKYTQQEVAEIVGVKKSAISNYENGYSIPRYDIMIRLAKLLDIKLVDFYDETFWLNIESQSEEIMTYEDLKSLAERNKEKAFFSFMVPNKKMTSGENTAWLEIGKKGDTKKIRFFIKYQNFAENENICIIEKNNNYIFGRYIEEKEDKYMEMIIDKKEIVEYDVESYKIIGVIEGYYVQI